MLSNVDMHVTLDQEEVDRDLHGYARLAVSHYGLLTQVLAIDLQY